MHDVHVVRHDGNALRHGGHPTDDHELDACVSEREKQRFGHDTP